MALLAACLLSPLAAGAGRECGGAGWPRVVVSRVGDLYDQQDVRVALVTAGTVILPNPAPRAPGQVLVAGCRDRRGGEEVGDDEPLEPFPVEAAVEASR